MTISQLRKQVKKRIDHLAVDQLRSAADYVAYLDETKNPVAIAMARRLRKAEREVAQGRLTLAEDLPRKR